MCVAQEELRQSPAKSPGRFDGPADDALVLQAAQLAPDCPHLVAFEPQLAVLAATRKYVEAKTDCPVAWSSLALSNAEGSAVLLGSRNGASMSDATRPVARYYGLIPVFIRSRCTERSIESEAIQYALGANELSFMS